jgi:hypothetical protein
MGMSSYVVGFVPPDEKFKKMKKVYDMCVEAEVTIPDDVEKFFDWEPPSDNGVSVNIDKYVDEAAPHDCAEGWTIDLARLAREMPHVKKIQFVNSY